MGYSNPKKQLDLKDFLSKPGAKRIVRNRWTSNSKPGSTVQKVGRSNASKANTRIVPKTSSDNKGGN